LKLCANSEIFGQIDLNLINCDQNSALGRMFLSKLFYSAAAFIVAACGGRLRTEVTDSGTYWFYIPPNSDADVADASPALKPGGGERPGAPIGDFNVSACHFAHDLHS
jgi:hypothetical protein